MNHTAGGMVQHVEKHSKPFKIRNYDEDGYKQRAACVCVRNDAEDEILLVTGGKNRTKWVVPGGGIESNETPKDAALREVLEEAGIKGKLGRFIGVFENKQSKSRTFVYIMTVHEALDDWDESKDIGRRRKWFSLKEASELLKHKPVQCTYLQHLHGSS